MLTGYKTAIFSTLTVLVGFLSMPEVQALVPLEYMPYVVMAVGVGNLILRALTSTPMFSAK